MDKPKSLSESLKADPPYYVTMTDNIFPDSPVNLVFYCSTKLQAEIVFSNANARSNMININITTRKPDHVGQVKTCANSPHYYQPGYFQQA